MPACAPCRMPTCPAEVIEGARASQRAEPMVARAQPVGQEGHVAGPQRVAQDGLGEAVDLDDDEARSGSVVDVAAAARHALAGSGGRTTRPRRGPRCAVSTTPMPATTMETTMALMSPAISTLRRNQDATSSERPMKTIVRTRRHHDVLRDHQEDDGPDDERDGARDEDEQRGPRGRWQGSRRRSRCPAGTRPR